MKVTNFVKHAILTYSYSCRLSVLSHAFTVIGNGLKWKDGELVDVCAGANDKVSPTDELVESGYFKMDYSFIEAAEKRQEKTKKEFGNTLHETQNAFERLKKEFIEKNIDDIAANYCARLDFNFGGHYEKNVCLEHACFFSAPEDGTLKEDWKRAMLEFGGEWLVYFNQRNYCFGAYSGGRKNKEMPLKEMSPQMKTEFKYYKAIKNKMEAIKTPEEKQREKDFIDSFLSK